MDNPRSFRRAITNYLGIDNLSENTYNYVEKLCTSFIVWIAKNITVKPNEINADHICTVLINLLSLEVATPYISRIRDRATKFDEHYNDHTKHIEIFAGEGTIRLIDVEQIFHNYYPGGSLDVYQALIASANQLLDIMRDLLEERPFSSNQEILDHVLIHVPNKAEIISKIDSILTPIPISTSNTTPISMGELLNLFDYMKEKESKQ